MNGDGLIDERDETFIGYSDIPENTYALSLGANYKNWGFSVMFQGVNHVSRYYDAEAMFAFVNGGKVKEHHLDRWNPSKSEAENLANAKYPRLHYDSYGNHNQRGNLILPEKRCIHATEKYRTELHLAYFVGQKVKG